MKYISWRRVSTKKQGNSGLGLEAQKDIIDYFVKANKGILVADYSETYTGKDLAGCAELQKAIKQCKESGATLIIAKTDRFRDVIEALQIYDQMNGNIFFCDLPNSDKFTLTLFFSLAEREALMVSIRTKAALKAKKERNESFGGTNELWGKNTCANRAETLKEIQAKAAASKRNKSLNSRANIVFWNFIKQYVSTVGKEINFNEVATALNELNIKTPTDMEYNPLRARAMYQKCKELFRD